MVQVTDVIHPSKPNTTGVFVRYQSNGQQVRHKVAYLLDKIVLELTADGMKPVGIELPAGTIQDFAESSSYDQVWFCQIFVQRVDNADRLLK